VAEISAALERASSAAGQAQLIATAVEQLSVIGEDCEAYGGEAASEVRRCCECSGTLCSFIQSATGWTGRCCHLRDPTTCSSPFVNTHNCDRLSVVTWLLTLAHGQREYVIRCKKCVM